MVLYACGETTLIALLPPYGDRNEHHLEMIQMTEMTTTYSSVMFPLRV